MVGPKRRKLSAREKNRGKKTVPGKQKIHGKSSFRSKNPGGGAKRGEEGSKSLIKKPPSTRRRKNTEPQSQSQTPGRRGKEKTIKSQEAKSLVRRAFRGTSQTLSGGKDAEKGRLFRSRGSKEKEWNRGGKYKEKDKALCQKEQKTVHQDRPTFDGKIRPGKNDRVGSTENGKKQQRKGKKEHRGLKKGPRYPPTRNCAFPTARGTTSQKKTKRKGKTRKTGKKKKKETRTAKKYPAALEGGKGLTQGERKKRTLSALQGTREKKRKTPGRGKKRSLCVTLLREKENYRRIRETKDLFQGEKVYGKLGKLKKKDDPSSYQRGPSFSEEIDYYNGQQESSIPGGIIFHGAIYEGGMEKPSSFWVGHGK